MTTYTVAQSEAIACLNEPLQIIACAGSGKTQVIAQRIVSILSLPGVAPRNVIAFTFTERAAAELKERIHAVLNLAGASTQGIAEMYVGTMHGYALDLVQRLVPETFKFSVLTAITTRLLIDRNSRKSGLTECPTLSPGTPRLRRFLHSKLYMQVTNVLREDTVDKELVPAGVLKSHWDYMKLLYDRAYFDFTEMINLAVQFLEGDEGDGENPVRQHIRADIRYLVVDEYQDVNPLQERLVKGLTQFGANLCVVGDDDQTIYQWRGSEVSNIVTFRDRYPGVRQVTLDDNFRSTVGIVEVGKSVAELIPAEHRLPKAMVASGHQSYDRGDLLALEFPHPEAEAAWICNRIQSMRGLTFHDVSSSEPRGLSWSDIAILFRSVANDAGPLVAELRKRDIPYVVKGLNRLFDSPEIQAVVGIFRYMNSELDEPALRDLFDSARLVPAGGTWSAAVAVLEAGRDFERSERWSVYNIQRLYLKFLEALELREETVPGDSSRAELVFYQLGKFSQAISDFETIYFNTDPAQKYRAFADWLTYPDQAPSYYADADADAGYAAPDAVVLSTVHQAKGMQWPTVFVPCLRSNRFPAKRQGGLGLFHIIPDTAVASPDRYRGTVEDETRLFYVAATRSQKYLFTTFSPTPDNRLYRRRSPFFDHCARQQWFLTRDPGIVGAKLEPQAKHEIPTVTLSFSELKYLFECPYQFKLRFMYGFNPPLHEALGYGKSLHDALAEIHKRALGGDLLGPNAAADLVARHLHVPYAYPVLKAALRTAAIKSIERYLTEHAEDPDRTVHSEKQIQVHIAPGITVDGRIDLVRRLDTNEIAIVDFKSTARAQDEEVTRDQLHVYAVGYQELTGERPDLIEVLNLDEQGKTIRELVEDPLLAAVRGRIQQAGEALRANKLPRLPLWQDKCSKCDFAALCRVAPLDGVVPAGPRSNEL